MKCIIKSQTETKKGLWRIVLVKDGLFTCTECGGSVLYSRTKLSTKSVDVDEELYDRGRKEMNSFMSSLKKGE